MSSLNDISSKSRLCMKYEKQIQLFNNNLYIDDWSKRDENGFICRCKIHGGPIYIRKVTSSIIANNVILNILKIN